MPRQVLGRIAVGVDLVERNTGISNGAQIGTLPHTMAIEALITSGLASGQMDVVYADKVSVTTGTDIDLSGGLTSEIGNGAATFARLNLVMIKNNSQTASLLVGGDANSVPMFSAANDVLVVPAGGFVCWYSPTGVAVTAGTGDIIQLVAGSGTVEAEYIFGGRSA